MFREREQAPRFAQPGLFEFEFGQKWKDLYAIHHEQEENLKRDLEESEVKLEMDMANAQLDHQANLLRQGACYALIDGCPAILKKLVFRLFLPKPGFSSLS